MSTCAAPLWRAIAALVAAVWLVAPVSAHDIQPALAELVFEDGTYRFDIYLNLEALVAGVDPIRHADTAQSPVSATYESLRAEAPAALTEAFDRFVESFLSRVHVRADGVRLSPEIAAVEVPPVGDVAWPRESLVAIAGAIPPRTSTLTFQWDIAFGPIVIRAGRTGADDEFNAYLGNGEESAPIAVTGRAPQPLWQVAWIYLAIGYAHILPKGLDHILFVVGLFLLSPRFRPLAFQVSAFTVAHTITLALGSLGIVSVPPSIVEPLIALSIVYVAVENLLTDRLQAWRPLVVFGFGLLHGFGFAGVLSELDLSPSQFVVGLVSFNAGVELGQLTVIAICFAAVGLWFRKRAWYRRAIAMPASLAVAAAGAYWFVERVAA